MSDKNYDELFIRGTNAQREKLEENEHKGGFTDIDIELAFKRLYLETDELGCLIGMHHMCTWGSNLKDIRQKAADVANFAHMIILKCDKELEK